MSVTEKSLSNLQPAKKGEVRNPAGKPKGTIHLSTRIQKLMDDPNFEANIFDAKTGVKEYKGNPAEAIIQVAINKAAAGDDKAREWLAKYGWGTKQTIEHEGSIDTGKIDPAVAAEFADYLKNKK